jgi:hypothetical protein
MGNAVITGFGRFRRRESASIKDTASLVQRSSKMGLIRGTNAPQTRIFRRARLSCNGLMELHKTLIREADRPELS